MSRVCYLLAILGIAFSLGNLPRGVFSLKGALSGVARATGGIVRIADDSTGTTGDSGWIVGGMNRTTNGVSRMTVGMYQRTGGLGLAGGDMAGRALGLTGG